ncbi:MAG: metallophosphoesterase family protein [bacterium]
MTWVYSYILSLAVTAMIREKSNAVMNMGISTERIFAIGDIHGCFDKLCSLMDRIAPDRLKDILIFLGDYIDRGPQSMEVVDYLLHLSEIGFKAIFLKGNHEAMLLDYLDNPDDYHRMMYMFNGGYATVESYTLRMKSGGGFLVPPAHMIFFQSLRLFYETDSHIFVHAGLLPGLPLNEQKEKDLLWIRDEFIHSSYDFGKIVVFGHTPFQEPLILEKKIGIDTGAVYGNKLSCLELPAGRFHSV